MKYYVYNRYVGKGSMGRETYVGQYDSWEDAISKVTSLYNMDSRSAADKGQYYYFVKEHY